MLRSKEEQTIKHRHPCTDGAVEHWQQPQQCPEAGAAPGGPGSSHKEDAAEDHRGSPDADMITKELPFAFNQNREAHNGDLNPRPLGWID